MSFREHMNKENDFTEVFPWIEHGVWEKDLENMNGMRLYRQITDGCFHRITSKMGAFFGGALYYCQKSTNINACAHINQCEMTKADRNLQKMADAITREYQRIAMHWERFLGIRDVEDPEISEWGLGPIPVGKIRMTMKRKHKAYVEAQKKYVLDDEDMNSFFESQLY